MILLVISWTCVGVFIATAVLTLLAMTRVIQLAEKKYLDRLVTVLVIEVVVVCVGFFSGKIELPGEAESRVKQEGRAAAINEITPEIARLERALAERRQILSRAPSIELAPAERKLLAEPLAFDPRVLEKARAEPPSR